MVCNDAAILPFLTSPVEVLFTRMAMKSRVLFIVAQVDGLEIYDESTFGAVKILYFAEVIGCSFKSALCRNEVSELVKKS